MPEPPLPKNVTSLVTFRGTSTFGDEAAVIRTRRGLLRVPPGRFRRIQICLVGNEEDEDGDAKRNGGVDEAISTEWTVDAKAPKLGVSETTSGYMCVSAWMERP